MGTFREGNWLADWQQWSRLSTLSINALEVSQLHCWALADGWLGQSIFGWAGWLATLPGCWFGDGKLMMIFHY
jgi:hypothetical protein